MEIWEDNFLLVSLIIAGIAWFVPAQIKFARLHRGLRLIIRIPIGIVLMSIIAAVASFIVHGLVKNVFQASLGDPIGAIAFFFETGFETTVLWFPVFIIRCVLLFISRE